MESLGGYGLFPGDSGDFEIRSEAKHSGFHGKVRGGEFSCGEEEDRLVGQGNREIGTRWSNCASQVSKSDFSHSFSPQEYLRFQGYSGPENHKWRNRKQALQDGNTTESVKAVEERFVRCKDRSCKWLPPREDSWKPDIQYPVLREDSGVFLYVPVYELRGKLHVMRVVPDNTFMIVYKSSTFLSE